MRRLTSILNDFGALLVLALIGLAGAASASATIDLIWADSGTPTTSAVSTTIVLNVVITAGPNGVQWAGISVDYSAAIGTLSVIGFKSNPVPTLALPHAFDTLVMDSGTQILSLNASCVQNFCNGLRADESHVVGTVQFHNSGALGTFAVSPVFDSELWDFIENFRGVLVNDETTRNLAFVSNVPHPITLSLDIRPSSDSNPIHPSGQGNL